jgi:hypothetical protein
VQSSTRLPGSPTITSLTARVTQYRVDLEVDVGDSTQFIGGAPGRALQILDSIRPTT